MSLKTYSMEFKLICLDYPEIELDYECDFYLTM